MDEGGKGAPAGRSAGDGRPAQNAETVASPCISVCQLDPATNRCLGCLRSLEEIRDWPVMTGAEKRAVLARLERRRVAD